MLRCACCSPQTVGCLPLPLSFPTSRSLRVRAAFPASPATGVSRRWFLLGAVMEVALKDNRLSPGDLLILGGHLDRRRHTLWPERGTRHEGQGGTRALRHDPVWHRLPGSRIGSGVAKGAMSGRASRRAWVPALFSSPLT
jgi:hypothetical protein